MALTQTSENELRTSEARVIAFFKDKKDAYSAINKLRDAGFTSSEIGLMAGSEYRATSGGTEGTYRNESFWEKVKEFFVAGDSHDDDYDYRDTSSGMDWTDDRADYYYQGITAGGALVSVAAPRSRSEEARRILEQAGGDLRESGFEGMGSRNESWNVEGDRRIQLRGEILRTYKDRVQRGEVRLRKDVITENRSVEVPVSREELVIERTPASGQRATGEIGNEAGEIRVPLPEERVRTEKQPVVNEEVRVGKRAVQRTENVSDKVRHEELRVDKDGDVNVNTEGSRTGKKKPAA